MGRYPPLQAYLNCSFGSPDHKYNIDMTRDWLQKQAMRWKCPSPSYLWYLHTCKAAIWPDSGPDIWLATVHFTRSATELRNEHPCRRGRKVKPYNFSLSLEPLQKKYEKVFVLFIFLMWTVCSLALFSAMTTESSVSSEDEFFLSWVSCFFSFGEWGQTLLRQY